MRRRFFLARMERQNNIGIPGKRAFHDIDNGNRRRPTLFCRLLRRYDIGACARLRHREMQPVFQLEPAAVNRSNGRADGSNGDACCNFHQIFEEGRSMIRRAARSRGNDGRVIFLEDTGDFRKRPRLFFKQLRNDGRRLFCFLQHQGGRAVHSHSPIFNSATKS